jgi:hypothetical protein
MVLTLMTQLLSVGKFTLGRQILEPDRSLGPDAGHLAATIPQPWENPK